MYNQRSVLVYFVIELRRYIFREVFKIIGDNVNIFIEMFFGQIKKK